MVKVLGVDVGGGTTMCGLVEDDVILESASVKTGQSAEALVESILEALDKTLRKADAKLKDVTAGGIGVPAFTNPATGRYRFPNIPGAVEVDLESMLANRLKVKHTIGNDADYAALGVIGHTREFEVLKEGVGSGGMVELVLLTLGTGIGGGVILKCDGEHRILSDGRGLTELGHIKVTDIPEYLCGCGAIGCVEATSSCTAIVNAINRSLDTMPEEVKNEFPEGFDAKVVDELSRNDNTLAIQVMESAGKYLGMATANLLNSFNPSYLAFSGGGANPPADSVFFKAIIGGIEENALPEAWNAVSIIKNPDAKRYGILGAAKAAINNQRLKPLV